MKDTGITRKVDELGRIVIAMELRKTRNMQTKDPIEIFVKGDRIYLRHLKEKDLEERVREGTIIRRLDELGRIVIPKEIRTKFGIQEGDYLDIYLEGTDIVLRKRIDYCIFCGKKDRKEIQLLEKVVCRKCENKLEIELKKINIDSQKERVGLQ